MKERPVYQQPIVPWYDSTPACHVLLWVMVPVFAFAVLGLIEALNAPDWQYQVGIPMILALLSFWMMVRMVTRIVTRGRYRSYDIE